MLKNPFILQMFQYLVVAIVLPVLTIFLGYWGTKIILNEGLAGAIPILFFAAISLYVSIVSIPILQYVSATVTFDEEGMKVEQGDKSQYYTWSDISSTRHHAMIGVLYLKDRDGRTIYVLHKVTHEYKAFTRVVREKVGILS